MFNRSGQMFLFRVFWLSAPRRKKNHPTSVHLLLERASQEVLSLRLEQKLLKIFAAVGG